MKKTIFILVLILASGIIFAQDKNTDKKIQYYDKTNLKSSSKSNTSGTPVEKNKQEKSESEIILRLETSNGNKNSLRTEPENNLSLEEKIKVNEEKIQSVESKLFTLRGDDTTISNTEIVEKEKALEVLKTERIELLNLLNNKK